MTLEERIEELERRVAALETDESNLPQECRDHGCSYYTHYLVYHDAAKHGAQMCHEAFHVAEKKCEEVQKRYLDWFDNHKEGPPPASLERMARFWENKICA